MDILKFEYEDKLLGFSTLNGQDSKLKTLAKEHGIDTKDIKISKKLVFLNEVSITKVLNETLKVTEVETEEEKTEVETLKEKEEEKPLKNVFNKKR